MSWLAERLLFVSKFLRNPRHVGALLPSSPALGRRVARHLPSDPATVIVELGAGTGALTRHVVERHPRPSRFLAVEIDPEFCQTLTRRWPSLDVECGSAANLPAMLESRGWLPAGHVFTGLPFASLPGDVTDDIICAVDASLAPGGTFTTFQYSHAFPLPPAARFRAAMESRFGPWISRERVLGNVPAAFVLTWRKPR
jgi:phospholipid N-methyltransferase